MSGPRGRLAAGHGSRARADGVRVLGLTGGIASGKTLVAAEIERLGGAIIDADRVYHELLETSEPLRAELQEAFGSAFFDTSGQLDRKRLASVVFHDAQAMQRLNQITHPYVIDEMLSRLDETLAAKRARNVVFLSVPLLYESGLDGMVDQVLVVWCPRAVQVERLMSRDQIGLEEASSRIDAQWPLDAKKSRATHVIDNGGTREDTLASVRKLLREIARR